MTLSTSGKEILPNVYPLGMGNSDIVLKDNAGNSATLHELAELNESNGLSDQVYSLENSAINIENSSDVNIGVTHNTTNFNAPVTIIQNVNGPQGFQNEACDEKQTVKFNNEVKLVKSESTSSDVVQSNPDTPKKLGYERRVYLRYLGICLIVVIVVTVIITTVIVTKRVANGPLAMRHDGDHINDTHISEHLLIHKDKWYGEPAVSTQALHHPTKYVIIAHTATPMCFNINDCSERVKNIQSYHINKGYSDIGYNFLIGGDGNVYFGRGWDVRHYLKGSKVAISISFIGNFMLNRNELTNGMIDALRLLLKYGEDIEKLSDRYILVAHNQTIPQESPGANVYKVIKEWPHFKEGRIFFNKSDD